MPQVIITISRKGQSKVETKAVTGSSCQSLSRDLEAALGKTTGDEKKPEFFQAALTQQEARR